MKRFAALVVGCLVSAATVAQPLVDGIGFLKIGDSEQYVKQMIAKKQGKKPKLLKGDDLYPSSYRWVYEDLALTEDFTAPEILMKFHQGRLYYIAIHYTLDAYDLGDMGGVARAVEDRNEAFHIAKALTDKYGIESVEEEAINSSSCIHVKEAKRFIILLPSIEGVNAGIFKNFLDDLSGNPLSGRKLYLYDRRRCPDNAISIMVYDSNVSDEVEKIENRLQDEKKEKEEAEKRAIEEEERLQWEESIKKI
ncbi:TPA: hypothetical protein ACFP38_000513 [Neisseria subflava]